MSFSPGLSLSHLLPGPRFMQFAEFLEVWAHGVRLFRCPLKTPGTASLRGSPRFRYSEFFRDFWRSFFPIPFIWRLFSLHLFFCLSNVAVYQTWPYPTDSPYPDAALVPFVPDFFSLFISYFGFFFFPACPSSELTKAALLRWTVFCLAPHSTLNQSGCALASSHNIRPAFFCRLFLALTASTSFFFLFPLPPSHCSCPEVEVFLFDPRCLFHGSYKIPIFLRCCSPTTFCHCFFLAWCLLYKFPRLTLFFLVGCVTAFSRSHGFCRGSARPVL